MCTAGTMILSNQVMESEYIQNIICTTIVYTEYFMHGFRSDQFCRYIDPLERKQRSSRHTW